MGKFDLPLVTDGLTAYAIERQNGFERHLPDGAPPWTKKTLEKGTHRNWAVFLVLIVMVYGCPPSSAVASGVLS